MDFYKVCVYDCFEELKSEAVLNGLKAVKEYLKALVNTLEYQLLKEYYTIQRLN